MNKNKQTNKQINQYSLFHVVVEMTTWVDRDKNYKMLKGNSGQFFK